MDTKAPTRSETRYEAALQSAIADLFAVRRRWEEKPVSNEERLRIESQFSELILALSARLPLERRLAYEPQFEELCRPRSYKCTPLHEQLVETIRRERGRTWTTEQIQKALERQGVGAERKSVTNCVDYLVRTNRLQRVGRGLYYAPDYGAGVITSDDLGGEPARYEGD